MHLCLENDEINLFYINSIINLFIIHKVHETLKARVSAFTVVHMFIKL
jgi:hypothetical protein